MRRFTMDLAICELLPDTQFRVYGESTRSAGVDFEFQENHTNPPVVILRNLTIRGRPFDKVDATMFLNRFNTEIRQHVGKSLQDQITTYLGPFEMDETELPPLPESYRVAKETLYLRLSRQSIEID
jgi:hypothetical protein